MFCGNCGKNIPDQVTFCPSCGKPTTKSVPVAEEPKRAPVTEEPKSVYCPGCGQPSPAGTAVCGYCGAPLSGMGGKRSSGKKSAPKLWVIILAAVVAVAAVIGIVGAACGWFSSEPAEAVWDGAQKTVFADNFTMDINNGMETMTCKVALDEDKQEVTAYAEYDGEMSAIYKNHVIEYSSYYDEYDADDMGDSVAQIFEIYEMVEDGIDREDIQTVLGTFLMGGNVDADMIASQISSVIDLDELENYIDQVWDNFNDSKWLEENLNYRKDGSTHTFEINVYTLLTALLEDAEDVFPNAYIYEQLMSQIRGMGSQMAVVTLELQVTIEGGELTQIKLAPMGMGGVSPITIKFYDIGSTKIDTDRLDRILEEALGY